MNEKRPWHQPKLQLLDAAATAGDPTFTTDDSSSDDFVDLHNPDNGNLHDHTTAGAADFS